MRKVWISPYVLTEVESDMSRQGFLIKLQTSDFENGYADYFPWAQFGDWDVIQAEKAILENRWDNLLEKSFYFAEMDGLARQSKRSLFKQDFKVRNHQLITSLKSIDDQWIHKKCEDGFSTFKIKVGTSFDEETKALTALCQMEFPILLRLDFNDKYSDKWLPFLKQYADRIEFIEDPSPQKEIWQEIREETMIHLAYDQSQMDVTDFPCDLRVIKPAKQDIQLAQKSEFVVTSYLDHPVGIAHAYWQAQSLGLQKRHYGLMSWNLYQKTLFNFWIQESGPHFNFKSGYGIGFDDIWDTLEWKRLI